MSKINVNAWEPESGTDLTLGASGDTITIPSGATITNSGTASGFDGLNKWTPVTATDTTFDLQSGTTKLIIEVQAAGGDGGASDSGTRIGGCGGSGAYAKKLLTGMSDTDTLNITIGAAAGVAASGTTTSVASASGTSFTTITCTGGAGGVSGNGSSYGSGGAGGAVPTTGDLNIAGTNGHKVNTYPRSAGVDSQYGGGGAHNTDHYSTGGSATGYGAGGQGGAGVSNSGGAGSPGLVIIWEYK